MLFQNRRSREHLADGSNILHGPSKKMKNVFGYSNMTSASATNTGSLLFVHHEKDIDPRFLKFFEVETIFNNAQYKSKYNYHLDTKGTDDKNTYYKKSSNVSHICGTLSLIQHRPYTKNGVTYPYRCVGTYFKTFKYAEGFSELLRHPEYANNYCVMVKAVTTNENGNQKSNVYIHIYVDRQLLLEIYEKQQIPGLINKILSDPEYLVEPEKPLFPCDEDLSRFNTEINQTNLNVTYHRKPFPHQMKNIQWMIDQEIKVDQNLLEITAIRPPQEYEIRHISSIDETLYYEKSTGKIIDPSILPKFVAKLKGGVLADDIGLGKTMSCIGLIAERAQTQTHMRSVGPPMQDASGGAAGSASLGYEEGGYDAGGVPSRGGFGGGGAPPLPSLIICPSRLCKQWSDEIQCSVGNKLTSIIIGTITNFRTFLKSPNKYQAIILSYSFLVNESYRFYLEYEESATEKFDFTKKVWGRIILDEGHEFLKKIVPKRHAFTQSEKVSVDIRDILMQLKSKYYWVCSGTPYRGREKEDIYYLLKFISGGEINLEESEISEQKYEPFVIELFSHIFRKNRQDNNTQLLNIPEPVFKTQFLKMTPFELRMYKSVEGDRDKMIQYCNHILVSEDYTSVLGNELLTLAQIHEKMTVYLQAQTDKLTRRIEIYKEDIRRLTAVDAVLNADKIRDFQEKMRLANSDLNTNKAKYNLFNQIDTRAEEFQRCPICYTDINGDNVPSAISVCGHFFCVECMKQLFSTASVQNCPICRHSLKKGDITVIGENVATDQQVIDKYGTKMAHLIKYLKEVTAISYQRVIVFSQYDSLLRLVGRTLEESGINYIVFNGSINVLMGRIRKFKIDDTIKVALMSSERAPSGLNLTEANHIVLLDTINTDRESAKVIEAQAIGRAVRIGQKSRVEIKRFIMLDTIEHEYYLRNCGNTIDPTKLEHNPFGDEISDVKTEIGLCQNIVG